MAAQWAEISNVGPERVLEKMAVLSKTLDEVLRDFIGGAAEYSFTLTQHYYKDLGVNS